MLGGPKGYSGQLEGYEALSERSKGKPEGSEGLGCSWEGLQASWKGLAPVWMASKHAMIVSNTLCPTVDILEPRMFKCQLEGSKS